MIASEEIRAKASLFGWERYEQFREDIFLHSNNRVHVLYRRDGSVDVGERFEFVTLSEGRLVGSASGKNKKATIISWLAELA